MDRLYQQAVDGAKQRAQDAGGAGVAKRGAEEGAGDRGAKKPKKVLACTPGRRTARASPRETGHVSNVCPWQPPPRSSCAGSRRPQECPGAPRSIQKTPAKAHPALPAGRWRNRPGHPCDVRSRERGAVHSVRVRAHQDGPCVSEPRRAGR